LLNIVISFIALLFLLGLVAYILFLLANNFRAHSIYERNADFEADMLKAQVGQIMDKRRLETEQIQLSWNGFRKFKIVSKLKETCDVTSFYLYPHDGKPLPDFLPGQFLTFQFLIPGESKPVIRCYSLSDSPNPERYRVTVKRLPAPKDDPGVPPGLVSNYLHESLNEHDIVNVKAPSGHFCIDLTKISPLVLLSGGVGITPMLSMLNTIKETGSQREIWFFHGVRNKEEHLMKEHLETVARENPNIHIIIFYSAPAKSDALNDDYHVKGRVTVANIKPFLPSSNYNFYICGPPPMIKDLRNDLAEWGVPKKNIHFEAFGRATVKTCKPDASNDKTPKINIRFSKSGKTLSWDPNLSSLLEFGEKNGIPLESGCRAGNCGTCLTAIKNGEVDYASEPGSTPEEGLCLICIAVPKGDLTLDA